MPDKDNPVGRSVASSSTTLNRTSRERAPSAKAVNAVATAPAASKRPPKATPAANKRTKKNTPPAAPADVNMFLMDGAKESRQAPTGPMAANSQGGRTRCWCHPHYRAQDDSGEWNVAVTDANYPQLSSRKAKVVCSFCLSSLQHKHAVQSKNNTPRQDLEVSWY